MGASSSHTNLIAYDEAVRRLGKAEVEKIEEGFARLAVCGVLRRTEFRNGFLNSGAGAPVPEALAEALFRVFDSDASGHLSVKEFICGVAVLQVGKPEEKLRLLFLVYDTDRDRRLSDKDLARFVEALKDGRCATREKAVENALQGLREAGGSIDFTKFAHWAQSNLDSPLVDWITHLQHRFSGLPGGSGAAGSPGTPRTPASRMVPLERSTSSLERVENAQLTQISQEAGLEFERVKELHESWKAIRAESQFGVIDAALFHRVLPSIPQHISTRLFRALDLNNSGTLDMVEWTQGLGTCLFGNVDSRLQLVLRLYGKATSNTFFLDTAAAETLQRDAQAAFTIFKLEETSPLRPVPRMLRREELALQPWLSDVENLARGIGHAVRIDLKMPPPELTEERAIVDRLSNKFNAQSVKAGETWYLISKRWWDKWCEATGPGAKTREQGPPSIDNSSLVDRAHGTLRIGLHHRQDYEVVTAAAWGALWAWYGGSGPVLPRQVIELDGRPELEMYRLLLIVSRTNEAGMQLMGGRPLEVSKASTLRAIKKEACQLHGLEESAVVLFHRGPNGAEWSPVDEGKTPHELSFIDEQQLLLRLKVSTESAAAETPSPEVQPKKAIVGLQNLGNTCYMNSALQCLLHTPLIPDYFNEEYLHDLNTEGSWGMGGKLAVHFAELLAEVKKAREDGESVVAPNTFKRVFSDFQPQFAGWRQQDAQEFLSVFLAGLSEDVNRARSKPYVELKDSKGRPDAEVAAEYWVAHCSRENSLVAAAFSGQFKSVIRCEKCGHLNAAFDPFSFLPVPLPEHEFRWVTCIVVSSSSTGVGQQTRQVCPRVMKRGTALDLLAAVAGLLSLEAEDLILAEVADGYVFRLLDTSRPLADLSDDVRPWVFHAPFPGSVRRPTRQLAPISEGDAVEPPASSMVDEAAPEAMTDASQDHPSTSSTASPYPDASAVVTVHLVHRRLRKVDLYYRFPYKSELFGSPLLVRLPAHSQAEEIYQTVWRLVRHLVPDMEEPKDGWPFHLSTVKRDGTACAYCSWRTGCAGCILQAKEVQLTLEETLSIDWDAQVLHEHFKVKISAHIQEHESVELAKIERTTHEQLTKCLDGLTKPEDIVAYCRECTKSNGGDYTETPHSKTLRIWGCPPLLVLQLKRFHTLSGASYKLHNLVTFPMELDLDGHLAESDGAAQVDYEPTEELPTSTCLPLPTGFGSSAKEVREAFRTLSRTRTKYQLYGVVNHMGGMGSGHYTAYVKHEGRWLCCNDSRVYNVAEEDVVTPYAYLLFYSREDVDRDTKRRDIFTPHLSKVTAVDPLQVKQKKWARKSNEDTRAPNGSPGSCASM